MKRLVEVTIDGKPFALRSDAEKAYLEELAAFFEARFKEVGSRKGVNPYHQAVLAALNIAEELFRERERTEVLKQSVRERCERIKELIERLEPAPGRGPQRSRPEPERSPGRNKARQ